MVIALIEKQQKEQRDSCRNGHINLSNYYSQVQMYWQVLLIFTAPYNKGSMVTSSYIKTSNNFYVLMSSVINLISGKKCYI